jgi:hypothetical protein
MIVPLGREHGALMPEHAVSHLAARHDLDCRLHGLLGRALRRLHGGDLVRALHDARCIEHLGIAGDGDPSGTQMVDHVQERLGCHGHIADGIALQQPEHDLGVYAVRIGILAR